MLDHAFTDAIDALRQSLEDALLERLAVEEHLNADVLVGDLTWETSYGLLGEESPARMRADITMQWPAWSQGAFRQWYVGDGFGEPPHMELEITLRIQRLAKSPEAADLYAAMPNEGPAVGNHRLLRSGPTVERSYDDELEKAASAFEVAYRGSYELNEDTLEDSSHIDEAFSAVGGWIAAALVRVNDLGLEFNPPEGTEPRG